MPKYIILIGCCIFQLLISCSQNKPKVSPAVKKEALVNYVNPFIGTGAHGHTYPGATMPFGMIQLSPDTRLDGWDGCSGYHYSDNYIYGFSHTHLSGTGVSDYGDVLLMPTNKAILNNGADGKAGYRAHFSHDNEIAKPGYYEVVLDSTNIKVALTVSERSGMHQYEYPSSENQFLILDLSHRDELLDHQFQMISATEMNGYRFSKAWATNQKIFFHIQFSKPIKNWNKKYDTVPQKEAFEFINPDNEPVYVTIGISAVDMAGAKQNLEKEIGNASFEAIKEKAFSTWEKQLEKIIIEDPSTTNKTIFYTSLYHTMIAPNLFQDTDGRYRGMDDQIHQNKNTQHYTVFSLWDTYRATHPLYTIIEQDRTNEFIQSFIDKKEAGGIIPIWDLANNYTGCMIGYHAIPVIADAYMKGIRGYDTEKAFEAMKHSASQDQLGLASYKDLLFIPVEKESESVSKTLEYAYDDWTIAQMAKAMNKEEDYQEYIQRAQAYKNVFDPNSKFMRGRIRNTWFAPFDPYEVNFNYTEANSWQYSFYVPQDISGFISLMGGKKELEKQLDDLFTANDATSGRHQVDITGLIGQYAHGNEPSHHIAYLYNFINRPDKTQKMVRKILKELYENTPEGISGNEDCGQMSAWYVLSSLGFYPVTPGANEYIIGSPLFKKATIQLENGNSFTIEAQQVSDDHIYIKSATLNGEPLNHSSLNHMDIVNGGHLMFEMTNIPTQWATQDEYIPKTSIIDSPIVPAPYIEKGNIAFKDTTRITLNNAQENVSTYYNFNDTGFKQYVKPITIAEEGDLEIYSEFNGTKSATITTQFLKIDPNTSITLHNEYANQYNGGGQNALIDRIHGGLDFRAGAWQGYFDTDVTATINLGTKKTIQNIIIGCLEDQRSWIFYPTNIRIYGSKDGTHFDLIESRQFETPKPSEEVGISKSTFKNLNTEVQFIKVEIATLGDLPTWHLGAKHNGKSWLFIDEITIK